MGGTAALQIMNNEYMTQSCACDYFIEYQWLLAHNVTFEAVEVCRRNCVQP